MTDPDAIHDEMLRLEADFHAEGRPDSVPMDEAIAELAGLGPVEMGDFDRLLDREVQRACDLALTYYSDHTGARTPYLTTAIGFLQGVTFARAVSNLQEGS